MDLVLLCDMTHKNKGNHTNFQKLWVRPYKILKIHGANTYHLNLLTGELVSFPINKQFLKHYFECIYGEMVFIPLLFYPMYIFL